MVAFGSRTDEHVHTSAVDTSTEVRHGRIRVVETRAWTEAVGKKRVSSKTSERFSSVRTTRWILHGSVGSVWRPSRSVFTVPLSADVADRPWTVATAMAKEREDGKDGPFLLREPGRMGGAIRWEGEGGTEGKVTMAQQEASLPRPTPCHNRDVLRHGMGRWWAWNGRMESPKAKDAAVGCLAGRCGPRAVTGPDPGDVESRVGGAPSSARPAGKRTNASPHRKNPIASAVCKAGRRTRSPGLSFSNATATPHSSRNSMAK